MEDATRAMATWLGALARTGVVHGADANAGENIAAYVVGEEKLAQLHTWFALATPAEVTREKVAAIEVCIWMAYADRELDPEECALLTEIVAVSGLEEEARRELLAATTDPPSLKNLVKRLTQPVLRELMLALAWELAQADGRISRAENDFYRGLARKLEITDERAEAIREAVSHRLA
jgi:uncharacterized membrane protein YebE (DUF533 family)